MSKTAAQHDFSYSYGEEVSPELAKKVMDDVYKMVEFKKALDLIKEISDDFSIPHRIARIDTVLEEVFEK